jgi:hypothetical protein
VSTGDVDFGTPFNVIAAFPPEHDSTVAVDVLAADGVARSAITVHRPTDGPSGEEVAELEAEMQDELMGSWGALSGRQARAAFAAAATLGAAGLVIGVVAGLGWAYLLTSGLSRLGRVIIAGSVAGLAGATIGLVDGGSGLTRRRGREAAPDDGSVPAERDVLVVVHVTDSAVAERAAARLQQLGAEKVHLVDAHGIPLPPQAQHPRPADPEGWWWTRAGDG